MSCGINCEQNKPAEIPRYVIMQKKIELSSKFFLIGIHVSVKDLKISQYLENLSMKKTCGSSELLAIESFLFTKS